MPDIVFVRANQNKPVREGNAVTTFPNSLTAASGAGIFSVIVAGSSEPPSGQASFAQTVLSTKFRNHAYYEGVADQADNSAQPTF